MAKLYLVRHGHAAAGFDTADPGLDALGRTQAEDAARTLEAKGPVRILTSPLARARETALPLARAWGREPIVETAVAEIPTPAGLSLSERVPWLRKFMAGSWRDADRELAAWRETAIARLLAMTEDTVIFSHFIAINVALGFAQSDERVVIFAPDNGSITLFETNGQSLRLIERGREASTRVN